MSAAEFFAASNVLIVAGKGGVGKTTVGASVGIAAARAGVDVLLVELEGYSNLGSLFGVGGLGYDEVELPFGAGARRGRRARRAGRLRARQIEPDDALGDYLDRAGLGPVTSRLTAGAMEVVATAAPGIRDLLALGKIRQIEQARAADLIVVDAPAAGHALTFLTAAAGLADSTSSGPVRHQADLVLEMFADADRCQVVLVTLPEETPVTEAVETAFRLEEDVGIKLAPIAVNGVWPAIDGLAQAVGTGPPRGRADAMTAVGAYRLAREADQEDEMARLARELPLPQLRLPYLFRSDLGLDDLSTLATALDEQLADGAPPLPAVEASGADGAGAGSAGVADVSSIVGLAAPAGPAASGSTDGPTDGVASGAGRSLVDVARHKRVVLCLGSGGVGKTTTAAALAIALARTGERVVVLTIDPARRLADALGRHGQLGNEATLVEGDGGAEPAGGDWSGEVWAAMLDPAHTLAGIVRAEAASEAQAERILANPLFRNLTRSLSGTSEYMATERLHQLYGDARFDRVIVDTPPSRHVMDFLDSPGRLTRFVDHRLYRSVLAPRNRLLRTINAGSQLVMRLLARLVGAALVEDVIAFLSDFGGLDDGFRRRAAAIDELLAGPDAGYVLVTAPRRDPLEEASWILGNLVRRHRSVDAVVVNRRLLLPIDGDGAAEGDDTAEPLVENLVQLRALAAGEAALIHRFRANGAPLLSPPGTAEPPVIELPELVRPVRDLSGLAALADLL